MMEKRKKRKSFHNKICICLLNSQNIYFILSTFLSRLDYIAFYPTIYPEITKNYVIEIQL